MEAIYAGIGTQSEIPRKERPRCPGHHGRRRHRQIQGRRRCRGLPDPVPPPPDEGAALHHAQGARHRRRTAQRRRHGQQRGRTQCDGLRPRLRAGSETRLRSDRHRQDVRGRNLEEGHRKGEERRNRPFHRALLRRQRPQQHLPSQGHAGTGEKRGRLEGSAPHPARRTRRARNLRARLYRSL